MFKLTKVYHCYVGLSRLIHVILWKQECKFRCILLSSVWPWWEHSAAVGLANIHAKTCQGQCDSTWIADYQYHIAWTWFHTSMLLSWIMKSYASCAFCTQWTQTPKLLSGGSATPAAYTLLSLCAPCKWQLHCSCAEGLLWWPKCTNISHTTIWLSRHKLRSGSEGSNKEVYIVENGSMPHSW